MCTKTFFFKCILILGVALRQVIPQIVGQKVTNYFELIKPLIEFKFEIIMTRTNNMFELATQEEIDKLGKSKASSGAGGFTDEIDLDEDEDNFSRNLTPPSTFLRVEMTRRVSQDDYQEVFHPFRNHPPNTESNIYKFQITIKLIN